MADPLGQKINTVLSHKLWFTVPVHISLSIQDIFQHCYWRIIPDDTIAFIAIGNTCQRDVQRRIAAQYRKCPHILIQLVFLTF